MSVRSPTRLHPEPAVPGGQVGRIRGHGGSRDLFGRQLGARGPALGDAHSGDLEPRPEAAGRNSFWPLEGSNPKTGPPPRPGVPGART